MSLLTKQIREINNDESLSIVEKNKRIQRLMCPLHETKSNLNKSCSHYQKNCARFQFSCCGIIDPCRRCHLERETCSDVRVKKIQCNQCDEITDLTVNDLTVNDLTVNDLTVNDLTVNDLTVNDIAKKCKKCGLEFGKYVCQICFIWTDKEISHCDKCGHCLQGKKEDLFHCDDCDTCFLEKNRETHSCLSLNFRESTCVICLEKLYGGQKAYFALQCKHFVHGDCISKYTDNGKYNCPLCKKSITDMKAQWDFLCTQIEKNPVPSDFILLRKGDVVPSKFGKFQLSKIENNMHRKVRYHGKFFNWNAHGYLDESAITKNVYKNIYCNDCEKKCWTLFHFYGLMCTFCRGFNTQE